MIGGCKEIQDEMIWQEIQEGIKEIPAIAREYGVDISTVYRIKKRREAADGNKEAKNIEGCQGIWPGSSLGIATDTGS